jgi:uncharacterized membrane protein
MKVLSIILIVIGGIGIIMAMAMFGDIGIAAGIGAVTAILSGIGFMLVEKKLRSFAASNEGK